MKMADVAAFDNLEDLAELAEGLTTFVRQAVADGTNAHVAEKEILQRILAMGRQAMGQFLRMQGEGDVGEMSTARAWDSGSASCRSTPGWSCPKASMLVFASGLGGNAFGGACV